MSFSRSPSTVTLSAATIGGGGDPPGRLWGLQPALGFLVLERPFGVRHPDEVLAVVDAARRQAEASAVVGVDCDHDVGQNSARVALADRAQAAPMFGSGGKMDLAGILDRQYVTTGDGRSGLVAPALDKPLERHLRVAEEVAVGDLGGAIAGGQLSQTQALAREDRIEKLSPFYRGEDRENDPEMMWF